MTRRCINLFLQIFYRPRKLHAIIFQNVGRDVDSLDFHFRKHRKNFHLRVENARELFVFEHCGKLFEKLQREIGILAAVRRSNVNRNVRERLSLLHDFVEFDTAQFQDFLRKEFERERIFLGLVRLKNPRSNHRVENLRAGRKERIEISVVDFCRIFTRRIFFAFRIILRIRLFFLKFSEQIKLFVIFFLRLCLRLFLLNRFFYFGIHIRAEAVRIKHFQIELCVVHRNRHAGSEKFTEQIERVFFGNRIFNAPARNKRNVNALAFFGAEREAENHSIPRVKRICLCVESDFTIFYCGIDERREF